MAEPRVTVVVTSRNRSELLPIALKSVQLQDFDSFECLVIDDASTDDSALAAQRFAEADPRFSVLLLDEGVGPSAARNVGIGRARGEFVCFLDDDDLLLDGSLRSRVDALEQAPADVAASYCDWINVGPNTGLDVFRARRRRATKLSDITYGNLIRGAPFIVSSPLLRRSVLVEAGGFDETLWRGEDADLWYRVFRRGFRAVPSRSVGVAYRRSPGSLLVGAPDAHLEATLSVVARYDTPDPTIPASSGAPDRLSAYALEAILLPNLLRYLALTAAADEDLATELGRRHLSAVTRRSIDPESVTKELADYAAARTSTVHRADTRDVTDRVRRMLERLRAESGDAGSDAPPDSSVARPSVPDHPARDLGARPVVVEQREVSALVRGAVVLLPEARYQVDELGPLSDELSRRGVPVCIMMSPKTVDSAWCELGAYTRVVAPFSPAAVESAAAVVSLNDWGPIRELMQVAHSAGVPTFAKVEGVQDFNDDDTGRDRRAYRTATTILCQGENDVRALPDQRTVVVGSSRLERLWRLEAVSPACDQVLVNLNFTFGVLTEARDRWIHGVADAVRGADLPVVVSRHPAERGSTSQIPVAAKPFRHEITRSGALISRFSTVPFEAMARGVPFVYHNPHGERVPTFTDPLDAFRITTSVGALTDALTEAMTWRGRYREIAEPFFRRQVDIDPVRSSAERTADVILEQIAN